MPPTCYWPEAEAFRRDSHRVEISTIQRCVENVEQQETIIVPDRTQVQRNDHWRLGSRV